MLAAVVLSLLATFAPLAKSVPVPRGFAGSSDGEALGDLARQKYGAHAAMVVGMAAAFEAASLLDRLDTLEPYDVQRLVAFNCATDLGAASGRTAASRRFTLYSSE